LNSRKESCLLLVLLLLAAINVPYSPPAAAAITKTMWLGYELTSFLEYNSTSVSYHSIPLRGANGTVVGIWSQKLNSFTAYDPTPAGSQRNQSLSLGASFGGFADALTRANFIKNALVGYGEVDANTPLPYSGRTPHKISYVGYINAYQKVYVLTANMERTLTNPPNSYPLCFWGTARNNVNVTWDETRNAYVIEGVSGFPHMVFGTLSSFTYRQMKEYLPDHNSFWWDVYNGGTTKTGWGENDTKTSLQSNSTSYIDFGLQFSSALPNVGDTKQVTIIIAVGDSLEEALAAYDTAKSKGDIALLAETVNYWHSWLTAGSAFSSIDYPWAGEVINQTLLAIMGLTWSPQPSVARMAGSFGIYLWYGPWWDNLYPARGLIFAGHYEEAAKIIATYLNSKWCSWGQPTYPNDYAWGYGFTACEVHLLWKLSGNDTLVYPLYKNLAEGWLYNITLDIQHGWDAQHNLFKLRGGLDHPWRYYAGWGGDCGWYTEIELATAYGLRGLAEIAMHFGNSSYASSLQNYSNLIFAATQEYFWNENRQYYNFSRHQGNFSNLRGYTFYEIEPIAWCELTPQLYVHALQYLDDWWKSRPVVFPYQYDQTYGGYSDAINCCRTMILMTGMEALVKAGLYQDFRTLLERYYAITPRPMIIGGESIHVNATKSASGTSGFLWSTYFGLNLLSFAQRDADNTVHVYPAINFEIVWPDKTKITVTKIGNDNYPLTAYSINSSVTQINSWNKEICLTVSPGHTYELVAYFGSRPAVANLMREYRLYNRTETWISANMTLRVIFHDDLPANRTIYIYSPNPPKSVINGTLLSYSGSIAAVWLNGKEVMISFSPTPTVDIYTYGAIAAAGGALAYILFRRRKKA